MASTKAKDQEVVEVVEAPEVKPAPVKAAPPESVYTAEDLIANHKAFKTSKEIVAVALRMAGKQTATFREAQTIIDTFKNKEVK